MNRTNQQYYPDAQQVDALPADEHLVFHRLKVISHGRIEVAIFHQISSGAGVPVVNGWLLTVAQIGEHHYLAQSRQEYA